jgi:hypothetical protein
MRFFVSNAMLLTSGFLYTMKRDVFLKMRWQHIVNLISDACGSNSKYQGALRRLQGFREAFVACVPDNCIVTFIWLSSGTVSKQHAIVMPMLIWVCVPDANLF